MTTMFKVLRGAFLALSSAALFQSCLSESKVEGPPYIIIQPSSAKIPGYTLYVKNIETGDSVWVSVIGRMDGVLEYGTIEKSAEFFNKVVQGRFTPITENGQEKVSHTFQITRELRDSALGPPPDAIDSLMVPGTSIGDFAPMKKGFSWVYLDSAILCQGNPAQCTFQSLDTVTYAITDTFTTSDTLFYRIATLSSNGSPRDASQTCYERGNRIWDVSAFTPAPCLPLFFFHQTEYQDTTASRFTKTEVLGEKSLVYSVGSAYNIDSPYSYDGIYVAKDIGAINFRQSAFSIPFVSYFYYYRLIKASLSQP